MFVWCSLINFKRSRNTRSIMPRWGKASNLMATHHLNVDTHFQQKSLFSLIFGSQHNITEHIIHKQTQHTGWLGTHFPSAIPPNPTTSVNLKASTRGTRQFLRNRFRTVKLTRFCPAWRWVGFDSSQYSLCSPLGTIHAFYFIRKLVEFLVQFWQILVLS